MTDNPLTPNGDPQTADHHRRLGVPSFPPGMDPRKMLDSAAVERVLQAQTAARAQAAATTTVLIGTVVTLITSAFSFVAALAWNSAITIILGQLNISQLHLAPWQTALIQALFTTIIAVIAVVIIQRVAGRWAKSSALGNNS